MKNILKHIKSLSSIFVLFCFFTNTNPLQAQWIQTNLSYGSYIHSFAASGTHFFAGTGGGVFLSTNNGTSWTSVNNGLTNTTVQSLALSGMYLFAGTGGDGVFLSTNNGTSWTANGLTNKYVRSFAFLGTYIFAGTSGGGVFLSTNNGTIWTSVNNGLPNTQVNALSVSGTNLFAGTSNGGVWRRPLSELISVQSLSTEVPDQFSLEQNYPNPFNPVTKLEFGISKSGFVSLKVFDLLGKEVVTLVNEKLNPGKYKVEFEGISLPSGVYLYTIASGEFTDTRRMMLIK